MHEEKNRSRERLALISHHFLSEPATETRVNTSPQILPILLDSEGDHNLIYSIARTFHANGITTSIVHTERGLREADPRASNFRDSLCDSSVIDYLLGEAMNENKPPPDLCLIPSTALPEKQGNIGQLLMIVPATGDALRNAYLRIKKWTSDELDIKAGIAIAHAADHAQARSYYEKLATGAERFLGAEIRYMGCLLKLSTAQSPASGSISTIGNHPVPHGSIELVNTLLRSGFVRHPAEAHAATSPANYDMQRQEE
jgi:hypothetical protein